MWLCSANSNGAPLFGPSNTQMPEEGERFQAVDATWRELMDSARATPSCLVLAAEPERLLALQQNNRLLDEIQKVRRAPAAVMKALYGAARACTPGALAWHQCRRYQAEPVSKAAMLECPCSINTEYQPPRRA